MTLAVASAGIARISPSVAQQASDVATGMIGWEELRGLFELSADTVHMNAMLISSHPAPVRDAIEHHGRGLDADPVTYLESNNTPLAEAAQAAAADYMGVHPSHVALTDSTTTGLGLLYNGLKLKEGQEVLTTTEEAREPAGANDGARMTPGGFKAFEHYWALPEAFALHERIWAHQDCGADA